MRELADVVGGDGLFDVEEERRLLREHDVIVWQFPWYWYAVPSLLKAWMDQVLTYGFAYGSEGTALHGKHLQLVISTGGPAAAYDAAGYNRFTMTELLRPLEATAHLCGMALADLLVLHGIHGVDDAALAEFARRYRDALAAAA